MPAHPAGVAQSAFAAKWQKPGRSLAQAPKMRYNLGSISWLWGRPNGSPLSALQGSLYALKRPRAKEGAR